MDSLFFIDFEKSCSPKELAYFLGFFWADGYNLLKNGHCVIEIIEEDMLNIRHIFDKIYGFTYYRRERSGRKPQSSLSFSDVITTRFFRDMGKYPGSSESHEKIMRYIPEKYLVYFIRGLFDGDGCFYVKEKTQQIYISGNYDQDWQYLLDYFRKNGFNFKNHKAGKKNKYSFVRCTDTTSIKRFIEWLYADDDKIYLQRKRDKSLLILNSEFGSLRENAHKRKCNKIFSILKNGQRLGRNDITRSAGFECRHILDKLVKDGKVVSDKLLNKKVLFYLPEIFEMEGHVE